MRFQITSTCYFLFFKSNFFSNFNDGTGFLNIDVFSLISMCNWRRVGNLIITQASWSKFIFETEIWVVWILQYFIYDFCFKLVESWNKMKNWKIKKVEMKSQQKRKKSKTTNDFLFKHCHFNSRFANVIWLKVE